MSLPINKNPAVDLVTKHRFVAAQARRDFPALLQEVRGKPLVYLDNAATTQKPHAVIESTSGYYQHDNANVHRGVHALSERSTQQFEGVRQKIRHFINAASTKEIIFTRGATESINLVANSFGRAFLRAGDEILISYMEHHSNIVPWQILCEQSGALLKVIPITDAGELDLSQIDTLLTPKTKLLAITHVSNALGTVNPIQQLIAQAHGVGAKVLIDGAQAIPHFQIDVQALDCDFYVFSGHKIYGPTGIGVLYGKEALLEQMPPYQSGGDMILTVAFEKTHYAGLPAKFEAGTPNIAGVIALGTALDYLGQFNFADIEAHEKHLLAYTHELAPSIKGLRPIGTAKNKTGVFSFIFDDIHAHDLSTIVDQQGVAIRAGHHCAMPVMKRMQVPATARASFALYNTIDDVDRLFAALQETRRFFT